MKEATKKLFMEAVEEKLKSIQRYSWAEAKYGSEGNSEKSVQYMRDSNKAKNEILAIIDELLIEEE